MADVKKEVKTAVVKAPEFVDVELVDVKDGNQTFFLQSGVVNFVNGYAKNVAANVADELRANGYIK